MGRLKTLTILLTLGAWGAATEGAPPSDAAPQADSKARPPSPVPPVKYLEAGARLFNGGQYSLAAKYLDAAKMYRDQLTSSEQTVLDAYLKEMANAPTDAATAQAAAPAPPATAPAATPVEPAASGRVGAAGDVVPAVTAAAATAPEAPVRAPAPDDGDRANTTDAKQKARWLLQEARALIRQGNYDDAAQKATQALGLGVKWGLFDDTPAKVFEAIEKARPKAAAASTPAQHRDRRTAKARLKEARAALANNQYEQAEAIALDIKSWGLSYGIIEDNPDKVSAAARALRRRDSIRTAKVKEQPSQGVYDTLVQESRQLMAAGKWDEAEAKARHAQRMNVVPPVTADRAEAVLHDLAMARARGGQPAPAAAPAPATAVAAAARAAPAPAEPAHVVAEREANALLASGDSVAASAKFAEADRLRSLLTGQPAAELAATVDPQVEKVDGVAVQPLPAPPEPEAAPVAALPDPGAAPPAQPQPPTAAPQPAAGNRGEQLLSEAKTLFTNGNYPAAKQLASEAKAGKFGVDAQADELLAQLALAEQGGDLSLYESALDAIRKGDNAHARVLLTEVAASGASLDEGMRQRVQDLLAKMPQDGPGRATASDARKLASDGDTLAAQRLNAEVGTKAAEARRLAETDPDKAIALLQETLRSVQGADIPEPLARPMVRRIEVAIELVKKDKVTFDSKMKDKAQRAEIETKRLRILEADKAKLARMKELMDKATAAMSDGKYAEAEAFAKRAQEIDPNEVAATILAWKARAERHYKRDLENKSASQEGALTAFQEVDAAAVADPEVQVNNFKFPKNFADLTRDRLAMNGKLEPKKDPRTLAIEAKLNDPVTLNMDKQPLSEAVTFLQNYTGLNIVLDPKALQDEGLSSASPLSLTANNIRLKTALKLMLKPMGLTYKVEDEVLLITSPQASQSSVIMKPYYVGDLVFAPNKTQDGSSLALQTPQSLSSLLNPSVPSANDVQAQTVALAGGAAMAGANGPKVSKEDRPKVDFGPLIQLITASIAPGTWRVLESGNDNSAAYGLGGGFGGDAGGLDTSQPIGSITPFFLNISLIIRHTAEIHEQVADLLRQLRRLQDLQVTIEVRFITVSDNFFEQIGVDFDFNIQSDVVGKHSSFAIPLFGPGSVGAIGGTTVGGTTTGGTTTGGTTTGGTTTGGTTGGLGGGLGGGGGVGGGFGSVGGGGNLGGSLGGGGTTAGGTTGGGGGASTPIILTNPIRDHSLGDKVVTVGTQGGGVANFTNNLGIPFTQGSAGLIAPSNAVPGAGATFGIAFLSDLEVYLFLTAAQGDQRTNILQAPKVTTFNGAFASIQNTEVIYYVSSLIPIVGPGSVAFLPTPTAFPNGVILGVTPVVSADRRYVRMTLSPQFTAIEGFNSIQVPAAVGGSGLGGGGAAINGQINLPQFTVTTISTTVTVPDGGTVLLGGVKRLNEQRNEFGVPVLAKTPLLNRLFRNIGIGRITSSLMMMVTPRIIILEEEEQRLGIPTISF